MIAVGILYVTDLLTRGYGRGLVLRPSLHWFVALLGGIRAERFVFMIVFVV
jgi:hypothetical protein